MVLGWKLSLLKGAYVQCLLWAILEQKIPSSEFCLCDTMMGADTVDTILLKNELRMFPRTRQVRKVPQLNKYEFAQLKSVNSKRIHFTKEVTDKLLVRVETFADAFHVTAQERRRSRLMSATPLWSSETNVCEYYCRLLN